jgi:uncharacterized membrane protein YcaP (DUF421 family)
VLQPGTPLLEIVGRTLAVYIVVLAGLRLLGKRQLGQMTTSDLVMILLIANAVQNAMVGPDTSLTGGLAAAAVLLAVNFAVVRVASRSDRAERIVSGSPTLLVKDGAFIEQGLRHEDVAPEEIEMAIREHGIPDVSGVRLAYLETDGTVSIVPIDTQVMRGRRKVRRVRQFKKH